MKFFQNQNTLQNWVDLANFFSGIENGKKVLTILEHCVLTFLEEIISLLHFETLLFFLLAVDFALDFILKVVIFKCYNLTKVHERRFIWAKQNILASLKHFLFLIFLHGEFLKFQVLFQTKQGFEVS